MTVVLSSLTDEPIAATTPLLLTVAARAENTGQAYNLGQTRIANGGTAPVVAEPVSRTVTFRTSAKRLTAHPLNVDGSRGAGLVLTVQNGTATLEVKPAHKTLFYVIESGG